MKIVCNRAAGLDLPGSLARQAVAAPATVDRFRNGLPIAGNSPPLQRSGPFPETRCVWLQPFLRPWFLATALRG